LTIGILLALRNGGTRQRIDPTHRRISNRDQPNHKRTTEEKKMSFQVEVDSEKCIGCEECVDICPEDVYEMQDEKSVPVNEENCVGCESCLEVCEQDAITITEM